jgi:hypothetical protein
VRKRESLTGPPGVKTGRRGDVAVAASGEGASGEEAATTTRGAAASTATETRTPSTIVARETGSTTLDTRAGGRKEAAAADTAGDRTEAVLTAREIPTEIGRAAHGSDNTNLFLFFDIF